MPATKTPPGTAMVQRLTDRNDELCFHLFAQAQLASSVDPLLPGHQGDFTTEAFPDNPHSRRIHVRVGDLAAFGERHESAVLGVYLASSYEAVAAYYAQVRALYRSLGLNWTRVPDPDSRKEHEFVNSLAASGGGDVHVSHVDTLTYLRMRRNAFVHQHLTPKQGYQDFCTGSGEGLRDFWTDTASHVDFTTARVSGFTVDEAITCIKLLRICALALDVAVADGVSSQSAARWGVLQDSDRCLRARTHAVLRAEVLAKVPSRCRFELGVEPSEDDVIAALDWLPHPEA